MLFGIIAAVIFLLTAGVVVTRKWAAAHALLLKIHLPLGVLLLVVSISHLILVLPLWKQRPLPLLIVGALIVLCETVVIAAYLFREKIGARWKAAHKVFALVLAAGLCVHAGIGVVSFSRYQNAVESIALSGINFSDTADGKYSGECDVQYIYARVQVDVNDGKVTHINLLEHRNERGQQAEAVTLKIVEEQRIDVDTVAGATNSSKVIQKAVENALKQGGNPNE